jgi:hypothetical protein
VNSFYFSLGFGPRRLGFSSDSLRAFSMRSLITLCGTAITAFMVLLNRSNASGPSIISAVRFDILLAS